MNRILSKTVAVAAAAGAVMAFASAAQAGDDPKCNKLSGDYTGDAGPSGARAQIVVGPDGKTVYIALAGATPNGAGTCTANSVTVTFPGQGPLTGAWDGKTIRWDNHTNWFKDH